MIKTIYLRAISVLMKKPFKLWGISLLSGLLSLVGTALFGVIPGVALGVGMLLSTSMTMIYLRGYRGEEVQSVQLFEAFRDWKTVKRVLCGMGWMALWVFLWALIPVVGLIFAFIRVYEYRLTPYILVMEPEISPTDAIKKSAERTRGYKGKMFGADILYILLAAAVSLVLGLLSAIPFIGVVFTIVLFVFNLAYGVLSPLFLGLVQAAFYEEITNPTIVEPAPGTPKFCGNCGAKLEPGVIFCPNCGSKL